MRQYHSEADGATVVLHVERVARDSERLSEMVDDLGTTIERVRELLRVRPVTVSEPRIVRRDQMIAVGQPRKKRFKHARRRGKSVQQEKRFRILRPSFPVENR